jgi:hypothetical protein
MSRVARIAGGTGLLIAGTLMLALPGPGLITIAAGLALLSKDVPAAKRVADWAKAKVGQGPSPDPTETPVDEVNPGEPPA